jgi:hypothetical protein
VIYTFNVTNPTPGTPKALATTRTVCVWVNVTGAGTATVYVAGVDPVTKHLVANATGKVGTPLAAGVSVLYPGPGGAVDAWDLSAIGFDVTTINDGVSVTYAVR